MERSLGVSALPGQRWAGGAGAGALNKDPTTPCHRVVNAKGDTAPGYAEQAALLEAERAYLFLSDGRVDLKKWPKEWRKT